MLITELSGLHVQLAGTTDHLPAWTGPLFRGLLKERFKRDVCRHPDARPRLPRTELPNCRTCSVAQTCAYPTAFEPIARDVHNPAPAGTVVIPQFPFAGDDRIDIRVLLIGICGESRPTILRTLSDSLATEGLGAKGERVTGHLVVPSDVRQEVTMLMARELPSDPGAKSGILPEVTVRLLTPLQVVRSFTEGNRRTKQLVRTLDFPTLIKESVSIVRRLMGMPSGFRRELRAWTDAASVVATVEDATQSFGQVVSRQGRRLLTEEFLTGHLRFAQVPSHLLPWLMLGGRLLAGQSRSSGCGSWTVQLPQ